MNVDHLYFSFSPHEAHRMHRWDISIGIQNRIVVCFLMEHMLNKTDIPLLNSFEDHQVIQHYPLPITSQMIDKHKQNECCEDSLCISKSELIEAICLVVPGGL